MGKRTPGLGDTGGYEIRTQGRIGEQWADWFDGCTLIHEPSGQTVIRSVALDQAALHGLLATLRDLGLPVISVTPIPGSTHVTE